MPVFKETDLEPKDAKMVIDATPNLQLVDVRQPDEFKQAHLAKAKLIPLGVLPVRLAELDKNKPLLLYCASGGRSGRALKVLQGQGFTDIAHIDGGISAWAKDGLSVER